MGSFPSILKFDSLGQYISRADINFFGIFFLYNLYKVAFLFSGVNTTVRLCYSIKNITILKPKKKNFVYFYIFFQKHINIKKLINLSSVLYCLFIGNKNILFISDSINYNYIPIRNSDILKRSSKNLVKLFKYFNIGLVITFNIQKLNFFCKVFKKYLIINVVVGAFFKEADYNIDCSNNAIIQYMLYVNTMQIYLECKKKNLS